MILLFLHFIMRDTLCQEKKSDLAVAPFMFFRRYDTDKCRLTVLARPCAERGGADILPLRGALAGIAHGNVAAVACPARPVVKIRAVQRTAIHKGVGADRFDLCGDGDARQGRFSYRFFIYSISLSGKLTVMPLSTPISTAYFITSVFVMPQARQASPASLYAAISSRVMALAMGQA